MNQTALLIALGILATLIIALLVFVFILYNKGNKKQNISVHSSLGELRAIGMLSVFKVVTKEIVTEDAHAWGEFGKKYLTPILTNKKMAMIFEFEIDFGYDLQRSDFEIISTELGCYILKMPPCFYNTNLKNIKFYDEQGSKFLPWLLPDSVNDIFGGRLTESDKNKFVDLAKSHTEELADRLIKSMSSQVEASAKTTLQAIARSFGATEIKFEFKSNNGVSANVQVGQTQTLSV